MLRVTRNLIYTCDCCGRRRTYTHWDSRWLPRGWRALSGRGWHGEEAEARHFCPDCAEELFGSSGTAWTNAGRGGGKPGRPRP